MATRISNRSCPGRLGRDGVGTLFQLKPPAKNGTTWTFDLIHTFVQGPDGGNPFGLIGDGAGNVIGVGVNGGTGACYINNIKGCGVVFEFSPPAKGQTAWTETVLYNFTGGADGEYPKAITRDASGNLFGVTSGIGPGCGKACGTVFELTPPQAGGSAWTETTLYTFNEKDGVPNLEAPPLVDSTGAVYGETEYSGSQVGMECMPNEGCGTIFKLTPPAMAAAAWKKTTLWEFSGGSDGAFPFSTLALDQSGNLFGLANEGGLVSDCPPLGNGYLGGCGTMFELSPPSGGKGAYNFSLLWQFTNGLDGGFPFGTGLTTYHNGFMATTSGDEITSFGSIDLLTPPRAGHQTWKEKTLFTFTNDANGQQPTTPLLQVGGVFYGMTFGGGTGSSPAPYGTIFSIKP